MKTYSELIKLPDFESRLRYLMTNSRIGSETFGSHRHLNQTLYRSQEWKSLRNKAIARDNGCDLAMDGFDILDEPIIIHHINPITVEDVLQRASKVFDLENVVCVRDETHKAIHYATNLIKNTPIERKPNDTCPWRISCE